LSYTGHLMPENRRRAVETRCKTVCV